MMDIRSYVLEPLPIEVKVGVMMAIFGALIYGIISGFIGDKLYYR